MADLKTAADVKDERISNNAGWKAQVLALYQKYFKNVDDDAKWSMDEKKAKSNVDVGGKSKLRSAGEHTVEEGFLSEDVSAAHTVVELPPVVEPTTASVDVVDVPKVEDQKTSILEPTVDQSKNTLVIKNLPFKFKPADLDKLLSDYNTKPKNVRLLRDESGRFSGMAFIRCPSKDEAQRLISSMNGMDIGGRAIQVEFKLKKKKKGKLDASCDSLSSSSDELNVCRLRISNESNDSSTKSVNETPVSVHQPSLLVQSASAAPLTRANSGNKLSVSAEHTVPEAPQNQPLKKPMFQPRRRSTSSTGEPFHHYINSAMPKLASNQEANRSAPGIRPVRQPFGPDGTNGFSLEYRRARGLNV